MDRYQKGFHFQASNSSKSSASSKSSFSGENNENDISQDKMDFKSQKNSKKPLHKHFMLPTVSETPKGVVPRKKVLGDKNESAGSSDVQFQKSTSLDSGSHPARSYSGGFSTSNSTSQFDGDELDTSVGDLSVKPYDPLTNYLSPRPQYLRYKPNRRRKILDRKQCLDRKEDGAFLERSSCFESNNIVENIKPLDCVRDFLNPPSGEGTATVHNQETVTAENDDDEEEEEEEEEEDIEEFEEEKRCSLKGVLKFFLLLVVIGLSTSYISSVNSPRTSLMQLQGLKDGCYRVMNNSLEAIPTNLCVGNGVIRSMQAGDSQDVFSGFNQHSSYEDLGKVQIDVDDEDSVVVESGDDFVRVLESGNAQNSDICVSGVDKSNIILDHLLNIDSAACKDLDIDKVDFDLSEWEIAESVIFDDEMDLIDDSSGENLGVEGAKTDVATVLEVGMGERSQGLKVQEMMQKSDSAVSDPKGRGGSSSGKEEVPELENNLVATEVKGNFMENAGEELKDIGLERSAGVTGTMENEAAYYMVEEVEGISEEKPGEDLVPEIVSFKSSLMNHDNHEEPDDSMPEEAWLKLMKARYMEFGPIVTACIGFSMLAILLASLVYINPARAPSKASQPSKVRFEESKQKEKLVQVKSHGEIECLQKKLESISISLEETRNELRYNQAPKVDFLGEPVIGKVSSIPINICGRESKKNETEVSKAISHADSSPCSASLAQSSALDTGITYSPSYGSFTAEKKILKKQGARDGRTKMITTSVRRSSRLQNRSIISP